MFRRLLVLSLVTALFSFSPELLAQWGSRPGRSGHTKGLEVQGGVGGNICLESGDAKCDGFDPSLAIMAAVGYRFSNFFGLFIDMNYGLLSVDVPSNWSGPKPEDYYSMSVMPTARFFAVLRDAEVYGGIGAGYARFGQTGNGQEIYADRWSNIKFLAGGAIQIWPNLYVGAEVNLVYNVDGDWSLCSESGGTKTCNTIDSSVFDFFQPFAFVKYRF